MKDAQRLCHSSERILLQLCPNHHRSRLSAQILLNRPCSFNLFQPFHSRFLLRLFFIPHGFNSFIGFISTTLFLLPLPPSLIFFRDSRASPRRRRRYFDAPSNGELRFQRFEMVRVRDRFRSWFLFDISVAFRHFVVMT